MPSSCFSHFIQWAMLPFCGVVVTVIVAVMAAQVLQTIAMMFEQLFTNQANGNVGVACYRHGYEHVQWHILFTRSAQRPVPDGVEPAWTDITVAGQWTHRRRRQMPAITQINELLR